MDKKKSQDNERTMAGSRMTVGGPWPRRPAPPFDAERLRLRRSRLAAPRKGVPATTPRLTRWPSPVRLRTTTRRRLSQWMRRSNSSYKCPLASEHWQMWPIEVKVYKSITKPAWSAKLCRNQLCFTAKCFYFTYISFIFFRAIAWQYANCLEVFQSCIALCTRQCSRHIILCIFKDGGSSCRIVSGALWQTEITVCLLPHHLEEAYFPSILKHNNTSS